jgi:hypothetical protein
MNDDMDLCLRSAVYKADSPIMKNCSADLNCDDFMAEAECEEKEELKMKEQIFDSRID